MDLIQLSIAQAKKQLRKYRILWVLDIVLLLLSCSCIAASLIIKDHAYNEALSLSAATDIKARQASYFYAIDLIPKRSDAYLQLLASYNEDGAFTKEESEAFLSCYNSNHSKLWTHSFQYTKLHYTAGLMYVNGYDADASTRLRMALPFLEEAKQSLLEEDPNYLPVASYCKMGRFYTDYIWNTSAGVREVDPAQMQQMVADIRITLSALERDTAPESLFNRLGFCNAVCNLFYGQRDLLAATVEEETVIGILDQIYGSLPNTDSLQKEQTRTMLQTLLDNEDFYKTTIQRAYNRTDGGT